MALRIIIMVICAGMVMSVISTTSRIANRCFIAEGERAMTEQVTYVSGVLRDRFGTNWHNVVRVMDAKYGPDWVEQLTAQQLETLHELRNSFKK